jgi:hypothetical protein
MALAPELRTVRSSGANSERPAAVRALAAGDFRRVAQNGFGDGSNSYAYSAAWYRDHLYVGSNRDILPLLIMRSPFKIPFAVPPVPLPHDYTDLDLRGQIWRYNVSEDHWSRVYHAPLIEGFEGRLAPQAFGFRAMAVFKGQSDPHPAIYTIPAVGRNVLESVTLRSLDGETFNTLPAPWVPGSEVVYGSFRAMVVFKDRLFVAPSSAKGNPKALRVENGVEVHITHANTSQDSAVLCSADPASGEWQLSSPPVFGDITNASIVDMLACGDYLYVGTLNVRHGFQLWRTTGEGPAPHRWELVIDRGADRGAYNQAILSMAEYQGDLYIGTCIQNGGFDRVYQVGPAAGEVLRVRHDGTWDIVVGDPRVTRHGLKTPTSGLRAGFGNPMNGYIWRMRVHEGVLYVGTCDISSFVPFSSVDTWPDHVKRLLDARSLEKFLDRLGGCELWRTTDGDNWLPVTRNGFDNRYNLGVRALVSTPHGLFVGTANPFGPQVAVRDGEGWRYEDNPRGGLEMWLGAPQAAAPAPTPPIKLETLLGIRPAAADSPEKRNCANTATARSESNRPEAEDPKLTGSYHLLESRLLEDELIRNPFLRLATTPTDLVGLSETVEDEIREYFGDRPRNMGFWPKRNLRPIDACRALVAEMCALAYPVVEEPRPGRLLFLADGAETLASVVAERFPDCQIFCGSADSAAGAESCDAALWIEPPTTVDWKQHLGGLTQFLAPGARVGICSITAEADFVRPEIARAAAAAGLSLVDLRDATAHTWVPFFEHSRSYWLVKLLLQQIDTDTHNAVLAALPGGNCGVQRYSMIRLQKLEEN